METTIKKAKLYNRKYNLFENLVLKGLKNLPFGRLTITLPNGDLLAIGNGKSNIEANIYIKNANFYKKCVLYGDLGFAEAYINEDWNTDNITEVIRFFILNLEHTSFMSGGKWKQKGINLFRWLNKIYHSSRANTLLGSKKNIAEHYDLGNDFYKLWLDKTMTYSGAYFIYPDMNLEEAQYSKYDRLCRQLHLKSSDYVLEIGSGWGSNAIHIAKYYGCKVDTVTISEEQYKYVKERIAIEKLSDKVSVYLKDYRLIKGKYDRIVSIEMLEAVGAKYYKTYFDTCNSLLKPHGLFALQVITCPDSRFNELKNNVDFIQKHIFPGSLLPSIAEITKSINATSKFTLINAKDLGIDYAKTLHIWHLSFNAKIEEVRQLGYSESFIRKWNYYLCYCEAAFEMRNINVMQLVYSRPNNVGY